MTTRIVFGDWTLLPDTGELWRGGSRRRLPEQALQVLLPLLQQPGELVTRDQLVARLWPETIVDYEAGLNAVVRKLRIALEDDAERPRYIETVPRRGYRYVGPLPTAGADDRRPQPGRRRRRLAAPAAAAAALAATGVLGLALWRVPVSHSSADVGVAAATPAPASTDAAAYDAYLKARLAYRDGDWLRSSAQASAAIARDPDFGAAYLARAAASCMAIVFNADASEARLAGVRDDLRQATRLLGPRDPMLLAVDAMYVSIGDRDHPRSVARFAEAEAAGLSDPTLLRTRAMQFVVMNRLDDAIAAHRSMAAVDPDNFVLVNMTAALLSLARRPDEASRIGHLVRERFPRNPMGALTDGRSVFAYTGDTAAWRGAFERSAAALPPEQRLQESFDLLRYEGRTRELLAALPSDPEATVGAGLFNGLTLCCIGRRPVAHYRGWAALLDRDVESARRAGEVVQAFAAREPRTRWNGWYLDLLRAEGLLMAGRHDEAVAGARSAIAAAELVDNMVHWRYAAAIAARVFAWGGAGDAAVAQLEALEKARPGLRPAEITHDPLYWVPLDRHPRFAALRAALRPGSDLASVR